MHSPKEKAGLSDWLAVAGAILGAFTAILDIQITNSSLANIEGAIGASAEQGSWISTAYLMAEIIVIPLTGWLGSIFGLRRYLSVNTGLFVGFSIACALSTSLTQLILFRAGQGFTGGVLIPTAITIVRTRLPKSQQGLGITLFGLTATFAPAIGPTVGGWLTDNFSWHYIFYLNLIPGPIAAMIQLTALPKQATRWAELPNGDWLGIGAMAAGLSSLTFVLEEGQRKEWFEFEHDQPIVDRRGGWRRRLHSARTDGGETVHQPARARQQNHRRLLRADDGARRRFARLNLCDPAVLRADPRV